MSRQVEREPMMATIRVMSSDHALTAIEIDNTHAERPDYTKGVMETFMNALDIYRCSVRSVRVTDERLPSNTWTALGRFAAKSAHLQTLEVTSCEDQMTNALGDIMAELKNAEPHYSLTVCASDVGSRATVSLVRL